MHEYGRAFHVISVPHAISVCSFAMSLISQSGKGLLKNEYAEGADTETNLKLATKVSDQPSCTLPQKSDISPLSTRMLLSCMPQWADVCPTWLLVQVLLKTMDTTTPSSEKVEFFTLKR